MSSPPVCGVVVTFHPEPDVAGNLAAMVAECGHVIVVDNASSPEAQARLADVAGVELIALPANRGVAAALNVGASRAAELGYAWIVAFDQDSRPEVGMVQALWDTHQRHPRAAVVGPRIVEGGPHGPSYRWVCPHRRWRWFFQRVECGADDLPQVTMLITSGSLVDLAAWRELGRFDEGLFIDYVDIDFCLKVVRAGRDVAVSSAARLEHHLGARKPGRLLGKDFRPMHHGVSRHYYMARNRVVMWRRHAARVPHWAAFDLIFAGYNLIRVLLWEQFKVQKIAAICRGSLHGVMGRQGPMAGT